MASKKPPLLSPAEARVVQALKNGSRITKVTILD